MENVQNIPMKLEDISHFLDNLEFKNAVFGYVKEDVIACMQDLSAMYLDFFEENKKKYEAALEEQKTLIDKQRSQINELTSELNQQKAQMYSDSSLVESLQGKLKIAVAEKEEYTEKKAMMEEALLNTYKTKSTLLETAKKNAEEIRAQAEVRAAKIISVAQDHIEKEESEHRALCDQMDTSMRDWFARLQNVLGELTQINGEINYMQEDLAPKPPLSTLADMDYELESEQKTDSDNAGSQMQSY